MALFPAFLDLKGKEVLVVGGGKVATRKVEKLLPFDPSITVVAPKVSKELLKLKKKGKIKLRRRKFLTGDLRGKYAVVVAADDEKLQRRIFFLCQKRGILCNSVDNPRYCNFIFPALVMRGDLVVGISSSGKAPALSAEIRRWLEGCLPAGLENLLKNLESERKSLPKGRKRQKHLREAAKEGLKKLLSSKKG